MTDLVTRVTVPAKTGRCVIDGCDAPYYGSGYCKKHHQWHWKRGLLPPPKVVSLSEKLRQNSALQQDTGCILWTAWKNNRGYGVVGLPLGKKAYAHRISYELTNGPIPEGMSVCHRCDTQACINPAHLFVGTHQENMRDSAAKGRAKQPKPRLGTAHHLAAFTVDQVRLIRGSSLNDRQLAKQLGAHHDTVRNCRTRITYRDVA